MSFQSQVYDCSAQNASVKISNNQWINEFTDGISLEVGDTVKVLGSFIQEKGGGDTIEIPDDVSMNLGFMPYVTAETLKFHLSAAGEDTQLNLGMFAQPAYATDNLGVEPPEMPGFITHGSGDYVSIPSSLADAVKYKSNPLLAKAVGATLDGVATAGNMNGQGDLANYVGWEEDCSSNVNWVGDQSGPGTLNGGFNNLSIPREFYISTLCKRLTVPVFESIRFREWSDNPPTAAGTPNLHVRNFTFDPSRSDGMEWRAGDYIASYFISGYITGSTTSNTVRTYGETTTAANFGTPRWDAGPRSVVGKILAIRETGETFTQHQNSNLQVSEVGVALGQQTVLVYEMYVWDFVNPASYKRYNNDDANAYYRHGSGELKNNYSNYPQNNNLNGLTYCCPWTQFNGQSTGQGTYQGNLLNKAPNDGITNYQNTNMPNATDDQKRLGFTSNTGLCFLWAGKGHDTDPAVYPVDGVVPQKQEVCGSWVLNTVDDPDNNAHWLCQPFYNQSIINQDSNTNRQQQPIPIGDWNEIGAIVRIEDINDDNARSSWLTNAADVPFLGIPYTRQHAISDYRTAYQNNRWATEEVVLGTKCGTRNTNGFEAYSQTNPKEPWASGLGFTTITDNMSNNIYGNKMPQTVPVAGQLVTDQFKGGWNLQNFGNDANCSIHLQTKSGDIKFKQESSASKVWQEDLQIIKKYKFELLLKKGYYTVPEIATVINDQLHYTHKQYAQKVGKFTTVGLHETQLPSNPSVVHGNFIHTYLPDVTYGIFPITAEMAAADPKLAALGVNFEPLTSLLTQNSLGDPGTNVLDGITDVVVGNFPYTHTAAGTALPKRPGGNCMFRFIGGKIDAKGSTTDNDQYTYSANLKMTFPNCSNDVNLLTDDVTSFDMYSYPSRGYYNNFQYGGSSNVWVGCPDPTFTWDDDQQKFYFSSLYTPVRPVQAEKPGAPELSSGEANPSVVINVDETGTIGEELGGVYITDLTDTALTKSEILQPDVFDYPDDTYYQALTSDPQSTFQTVGKNFWDQIGFSLEGIQADLNRFSMTASKFNPYLFVDTDAVHGITIRNFPKIDIALNGSNPFKSRCTTLAPYNQFFASVGSDEFLGDFTPRLSNTPFYLIGSDLINPHFHGAKGTKLPVIGLCGRNYERFSYVFDLSESAITYRVEDAKTVTSIRTHIYTNSYQEADNLFPNSSVVYIVQKQNFAAPAPQAALEAYVKERQQEAVAASKLPPNGYYDSKPVYYQMEHVYSSDDEI